MADAEKKQQSDTSTASESRSSTPLPAPVVPPEGVPPADPNLVTWDGPDDPENPQNFPAWKKITYVAIVSTITFITPLGSSIFAPGVPEMMQEFRSSSETLASFVVSVYVLGFACGPLVLAPLSELYGRNLLYNACNVAFTLLQVGCAKAPTLNGLTAIRFFAGCFGAAPLAIGGGTIYDLVSAERRGMAISLYAAGPLLGPVIGPVIGGYMSQDIGWRWTFWLLTIVSGSLTIVTFAFLRETHAPTLLKWKAAKLRESTGNPNLHPGGPTQGVPHSQVFIRAIVRPAKMLFFSPVVFAPSLFMAVCYGYLFLMFTTFSMIFADQYGFSTGTVGLSYLGLGIGNLIGLLINSHYSDKLVARLTEKHAGVRKPEYRLPLMIFGAPLVPIGLFWYGWSAENVTHWIVPILGTGVTGVGLLLIFLPVQTYLIDAFTIHAASALAANTVFRSVLGAILPLAGLSMYRTLGVGWGNSLLGFIAVALCPIPILFYRYGEYLRTRFKVDL